MNEIVISQVLNGFSTLGVVVFAISGALYAAERNFADIFDPQTHPGGDGFQKTARAGRTNGIEPKVFQNTVIERHQFGILSADIHQRPNLRIKG